MSEYSEYGAKTVLPYQMWYNLKVFEN